MTDPSRFQRLFAIVEDEVAKGEHTGSKSCAKGLLWLKRAMQFIVGLVRGIGRGEDTSTAVQEAYSTTLKPYHGMFSYGAFQTAFRFLPTSETLLAAVCGGGAADEASARAEFAAFAGAFTPLLEEVDAWIEAKGLNDPAKV
jgi:Ca2+:H+ antiporter